MTTFTDTVIAPKFEVGSETEQGVDPAIVSKRRIDNTNVQPGMSNTPGAHAFSVSDVVDRGGSGLGLMAYAGYEFRSQLVGSYPLDHVNAYQGNPFSFNSGSHGDYRSYQSAPMLWNGSWANFYGFHQMSLNRLPSNYMGATDYADIGDAYGVLIEDLGLGADRYAFKSLGASDKVDFAGQVTLRNTLSVLGNATIGDSSADAHTVNGRLLATGGFRQTGAFSSRFESTGASGPPPGSTGPGCEIFATVLQFFDRTSEGYINASVDAATLLFRPNGITVFTVAPTAITAAQPFVEKSYTVATLPTAGDGAHVFASDGRKTGEGAGAGTGLSVYRDGGTWYRPADDTAVAA